MPEHVHLLLSEPGKVARVGTAGVEDFGGRASRQRPFWQARYYDFNVFTDAKRFEKLNICTRIRSSADWWKTGRLALVELPLLPDRSARTSEDHT